MQSRVARGVAGLSSRPRFHEHRSPSRDPARLAPASPWWRGAIIYQIYPRSFLDTNGDGVGDLPGIIDGSTTSPGSASTRSGSRRSSSRRWRTSATTSPTTARSIRCSARSPTSTAWSPRRMRSGSRSSSTRCSSHTSDQHAWFEESRQSRDNPKADWYVWADAREDGTPPNNWLSIFGGVAWHWEPRRGQYYLHNFLSAAAGPELPQSGGAAARRSTTCGSGSTAASTACASTRSTSASTTRSCATTRRAAARTAHGDAASAPTIRTRSSTTTTTTRSRRSCRSSRSCAGLLDGYPDVGRAGRDLLGRFARDDGRVHAARPPAHGLQLRAADRRQLARRTSAPRSKR